MSSVAKSSPLSSLAFLRLGGSISDLLQMGVALDIGGLKGRRSPAQGETLGPRTPIHDAIPIRSGLKGRGSGSCGLSGRGASDRLPSQGFTLGWVPPALQAAKFQWGTPPKSHPLTPSNRDDSIDGFFGGLAKGERLEAGDPPCQDLIGCMVRTAPDVAIVEIKRTRH